MSTTADQPQRKLLLADANIFIDLVQAGGLGLIGDIVRFGIASIYVPRTIYDEISSEVSEVDIASLGITILPATEDMARRVIAYPDKRLSRPDRTLLLMAEDNGFGVWSNDRRLRDNCKEKNIPVYWEFQLLRELVTRGFMEKSALVGLARSVADINEFVKGVAETLESEL